ncbi:MAG: chromate transporter [Clostridia bacterium]|jgi:chromate transporter|nr:chromate transporter [Clostridia bacterium]MBQ3651588.1 chromate transporter [Clostridia bacterium]MBQ6891532.1 chromate transporter [Clostridia bacterium]MBQ7754849.1 chromate transporter [Clostridia bacterium]MBQ9324021.1 chromate transporter [Clostridia bacterium]
MIKTILLLIFEFMKTGLMAVGGGMACIRFLQDMIAKYGWLTGEELANIIAVAESTPGPIGVNAATYVGYSVLSPYGAVWGVLGGIISTLSLISPQIVVIIFVAKGLEKYRRSKLVNDAFGALRPAAAGLVAAAGWSVIRSSLSFSLAPFHVDVVSLVLYGALVTLMLLPKLKKIHPVLFLAAGGLIGALLGL